MMANTKVEVNGGISFAGLLAIVFITLKLTNYITWSWWWVLSPLWIPAFMAVSFFIVAFLWFLTIDKYS